MCLTLVIAFGSFTASNADTSINSIVSFYDELENICMKWSTTKINKYSDVPLLSDVVNVVQRSTFHTGVSRLRIETQAVTTGGFLKEKYM